MENDPARSWERAMKFQQVILRAMSKQITWTQAAEIPGMSDRTMRRYETGSTRVHKLSLQGQTEAWPFFGLRMKN